jgi:superfamily II DNA or RNA helicase
LFLGFPVSFKGKLVQYTGRLMRQCEGKTVVQVYDYADTRVPVLKRMFEKRMKTYRALGFLEKESGRGSQVRGGDTLLSGDLPDQAALYGVLHQIEALGLELLEVRRLPG